MNRRHLVFAVLLALAVLLPTRATHARWLDAETMTWLTRDPSGYVDGVNLTQYAESSPTLNLDSDGLRAQTCIGRCGGCTGVCGSDVHWGFVLVFKVDYSGDCPHRMSLWDRLQFDIPDGPDFTPCPKTQPFCECKCNIRYFSDSTSTTRTEPYNDPTMPNCHITIHMLIVAFGVGFTGDCCDTGFTIASP
jgi:hypothetical protein